MSPKKPLLTVGLTALGLFGYVASFAADPVEDAPAPSGPSLAPASKPNPTQMVLLKTNGEVLVGSISEDRGRYIVHKSAGSIPVPKAMVEKTFGSMAEAYRYKLSMVAERDPDEHLKFARWCLSQNLQTEALAQVRVVVALSPESKVARSMLAQLEANEARARRPQLDPGLVQTSGETTMAAPRPEDSGPAEIDSAVLRRATRDLGVSRLPVIFDLPPAAAAKRADQFARDVHPVLQVACARCHNEQYEGTFQLVGVKSRRTPGSDVLRANLDSTLRLIDPDNPARSELLSRSLVPHGNRANPRPIFRGSNDPYYQIIAAWAQGLAADRPSQGGEAASSRNSRPNETSQEERFAIDRTSGQGATPGVTSSPIANASRFAPGLDRKPDVLPPVRYVPGQGAVAESTPPSPYDFPAPYMMGGPPPRPYAGANAPKPDAEIPLPVSPAGAGALPPLPAAASAPAASTPSKPKKPLKIDVDLLQKALSNRYSNP